MSSTKIKSVTPISFPWQTQDPFLFCAYHKDKYPSGNLEMAPTASLAGRNLGQDFDPSQDWRMYHGRTVPGFPQHPHRGFETVSIVKEGLVDHADSLGAAGRFGNGDVQWMTAGKGVLHSEMFPLLSDQEENPLEMFQIWLNLPKKKKFVEPHFKMLWADEIPIYQHTDSRGLQTTIDIIAGELSGISAPAPPPASWASDPTNNLQIWTIKMEPGASWTLEATDNLVHKTIYFYRGDQLDVAGSKVNVNHIIDLRPDEKIEFLNGSTESRLLFLQGKPINEPVAQHGPFVMNTQAEIQEAFQDFRRTQFGGWPWPKNDQVHDRERSRFALHADGKEEIKDA